MKAKMTLTFSKVEIGEIIKKHLLSEGYELDGNFSFDVGTRLEGYGHGEYNAPYFDGCSVDVKPIKPKSPVSDQRDSVVKNDR